MSNLAYRKHLTSKVVELIKFCVAVGLLCVLIFKTPDNVTTVVNLVAAFLLGGSKLKDKVGL